MRLFIKVLFLSLFVFLISVKIISLASYGLLALIGIIISIKNKISPFSIDSIKMFSLLTLIFFGVFALSIALSDFEYSRWNCLGRLAYFPFAPFVFLSLYKADIDYKFFLNALKLSIFSASSIVLFQYVILHKGGRLGGMYNTNTFADILTILLIIIFANIYNEKTKDKILSIFILFYGFIGLIFTGSRGALLTFIVMLFLYSAIVFWYNLKHKKITLVSLLVIVGLIIGGISLSPQMSSRIEVVKKRVADWESGKNRATSVGYRLEMYKTGLRAFTDHPIFGYGYHGATHAAAQYASKDTKKAIESYWHLHNEYISTLVNAGLVGYFALMALFLLPLKKFLNRRINKGREYIGISGSVVILTYMVLGITHGELGYEYETVLFITLVGYLLSRYKDV